MKKIIIFAIAVATLFAFSSCQKENLQDNGTTNGVRIITAEFENNATKTNLNSDGVTPEWKAGDVIRILNTTTHQDVPLTDGNITDNKITFTTSLTGDLYAVYPATATSMTSCPDGEITFTIPAIQDGTFGSANICVAKSTEDDGTNKDNLIFRNATAVLKITTSSAVVGVDVTATNFIAGEVTATFSGTAISLTTTSLDRHYVSAVGTSAPTGNVFYLAAAPVTTGAAKVNCYTTEKKGTVEKESKDLSKNIIYNMDLTSVVPAISDLTGQHGLLNGHEYVIIKAKYDGTNETYLKWATMNIGATTLTGITSHGDYYMWGATELIYDDVNRAAENNNFSIISSKPSAAKYNHNAPDWNQAQGFYWDNAPFIKKNYTETYKDAFNKYTTKNEYAQSGSADDKSSLDSSDDAASTEWMSTWRMPMKGDFSALLDATYGVWDSTDKGYYVFAPDADYEAGERSSSGSDLSKSNALLFFPAAGYGTSKNITFPGYGGFYWSKSLDTDDNSKAFLLMVNTSSTTNSKFERYRGHSIRPVSN